VLFFMSLRLPQAVDCGGQVWGWFGKCTGPWLPLNLLNEMFNSNFETKVQHEWAILLVCDNSYLGRRNSELQITFSPLNSLYSSHRKGDHQLLGEPFTQVAWLAGREVRAKLHTSERYLI